MFGSGFRIALGRFRILWPTKKWLEACRTTHSFIDRYVDKAVESHQNLRSENIDGHLTKQGNLTVGQNLLYAMAEQTDDRTTLRNESLQAMMAVQETTAVLISNVFFLLARHANVWDHLRNEVLALGKRTLDADILQSLMYLRNVLNESESSYLLSDKRERILV